MRLFNFISCLSFKFVFSNFKPSGKPSLLSMVFSISSCFSEDVCADHKNIFCQFFPFFSIFNFFGIGSISIIKIELIDKCINRNEKTNQQFYIHRIYNCSFIITCKSFRRKRESTLPHLNIDLFKNI